MQRKNTARQVPILDYIRRQGAVTRQQLLNNEDSPVWDMDSTLLTRTLNRMIENDYITREGGVYTVRKA